MDPCGKSNQEKKYQRRVEQEKPRPPIFKNLLAAFASGGLICTLGQVVLNAFIAKGLTTDEATGITAVVMVTLGALLTAFGWYDELGKIAGAGSAVPITGFANSIVAPALEFKREGLILGIGARMFVVAGPVLVYGTLTSVLVGLIYSLVKGGAM